MASPFYVSSSSDSDDSDATITVDTHLPLPPPSTIRVVDGGPSSRTNVVHRPTPISPASAEEEGITAHLLDTTGGAADIPTDASRRAATSASRGEVAASHPSCDECVLYTASACVSSTCVVLFLETAFGGWVVCALVAVGGGLMTGLSAPLLLYCCWTFLACFSTICFVAVEGVPESDIVSACLLPFGVLNAISTVCGVRLYSRMTPVDLR